MASMKVSYSDLEDAFLFASYERHYWLDKQTGRVLYYGAEAAEALEEDDLSDLPDWMDDEVAAAPREVLRALAELPEENSQCSVPSGQRSVGDPMVASEASTEEDDHNIGASELNRYMRIEQIPSAQAFSSWPISPST